MTLTDKEKIKEVLEEWVFSVTNSKVFGLTHSKSLEDLSIYVSSLD